MQDNEGFFPQDIYVEYLAVINKVHFTRREIDVVACLLKGRRTSKIASLLDVAPSTVVTHIRNIMIKLECNSREKIVDFIEKSHDLPRIKKYYISLISYLSFEKSLQNISKIKHEVGFESIRLGIYEDNSFLQKAFLSHLEDHLMKAGVKAKVRNQVFNRRLKKYKLFNGILLLLLQKEYYKEISKKLNDFEFIDFQDQENYYFCVFDILTKLLPNINLEPIISEFKKVYQARGNLSDNINFQTEKLPFIEVREEASSLRKRLGYFLSILLFMGLFGSLFYSLQKSETVFSSIRSELVIPKESTLLHRAELITQIENKFNRRGDIQTVALVGVGGSGKTTLARQYARMHKANVIWQIDAETSEALKSSFEKLSSALAQTEEDQKQLRSLRGIKNSKEKEEKILLFVKERMKSHPYWLLIYDNVEKFKDIQPFYPHDPTVWGNGRIIITTQDLNIQNNSLVSHVIQIDDLTPSQKLILFLNIMTNGNPKAYNSLKKENARKFLHKIPPYPLDVLLAAYYLKSTQVSYDKYLKYLGKGNIDFEKTREDVLKEAENYKKTRYHIVILSFKKLMETHKDFADLLLFICLLDSQDIPIELLELYKNEIVVSDFIYHLKKYSLITDKFSQFLLSSKTISLHRCTQEIGLTYLTKILALENNPQEYREFSRVLAKYSANAIDREDLPGMKFLINHYESFLKHTYLLTDQTREILRGELGGIYFYTGDYPKAKKILEESLAYFNKNEKEYTFSTVHILVYLSHIYNQLAEYGKAKHLLEKSLLVYRKIEPQDYGKIAQLLTNLGRLEGALFNTEKSKNLLEQSLALYKEKCPASHLKRVEVLISLGNVYRELGDYVRAKEVLEQSLFFFRERYPETHIKNAGPLTRLGNIYRSLGQYTKAKELMEKSLTLYKKTYPKDHSSIAWVSTHLGNVYRKLGDYEKAKNLLEQSHAIYTTYFNENHIANAWVLTHLGNTYKALGKNEKARAAFEKGYDIYKAHNLGVAWSAAHLGNFYRESGQYNKAKECLNQSFLTYTKPKFKLSIRRALILRYLGNFHRDLQDYAKAKTFLEKSKAIYTKIQTKDTMEIALVSWDLGKVYFLEGNVEAAANFMKKALDIFQRNAHPDAYLILKDLLEVEQKK